MTLVVPTGYANCIVRFACSENTKPQSTAIGFRTTGDNVNTVNANWRDAWGGHMAGGALGSTYTITAYVSENVDAIDEIIVAVVGTDTAAHVSSNVSVIAKKTSAFRGRSKRGRMYLPGGYLPENQVDSGGNIDDGQVSDIQDNLDAVLTDMVAAGYEPVLFHDEASPDSANPTTLSAIRVEPMVGTQRRRLR